MEINGKTYRNLESQVGYLTEVTKDISDRLEEIAANVPSKAIVEELPEVGDPTVTYYVGPKGTEPNLYYEVWIWVQEEPDGPFVWRELEDTDSVDLSGYLEKQTGITTYAQAYTKNADGTQGMIDVDTNASGGSIAQRKSDGRLNVVSPLYDNEAANKKYCDDNFVAIDTTTTSYDQAYVKKADGTQGMVNISGSYQGNTLAIRDANGDIRCNTGNNAMSAVNTSYLSTHYVPLPGGGNVSYNRVFGIPSMQGGVTMFKSGANAIASAIVERNWTGNIILPDQIANPPANDTYAVSKGYVSQVVGQLIYKHAITLDFTYNSNLSFSIKINLINGTSAAYTSLGGKQLLSYLTAGCYSITTESYVNNEFWSVAVCASGNYIHGDTGLGLLLTSASTNATIYVDGIEHDYNANISSVSVSDVVTTW